ncbi:MAG: hypothetical protein IKO85_03945 [Bacteroidaceae bacterium]|nr:hypothetical protein [Bacteroidaceae bacterium]
METTKDATKKVTRRRRKSSSKENKVKNSTLVPQNKYVEAALKHQGSFIVYDPNFML